MPSLFGTYKCKPLCEKGFLLSIIQDVIDLLPKPSLGNIDSTLAAGLQFQSPAVVTQTVNLTLQGTALFVYYQVFGKEYPSNPTSEEISKINAVWIGIGHPENVLPT